MEGLMLRKGVALLWLLVVLAAAALLTCTVAKLYRVDWKENVNYTEWATQQDFYVGDWLLFAFDKRYYNVLEVNKTNYEQCYDREFLKNITKGGRDVFNLTEARPYYFLTRGGYCYNGMKLAINVVPVTPAPAPATNTSPADNGSLLVLTIMLVFTFFSLC